MTSLYPTTHGVHQIADRLPASATTIAEVVPRGRLRHAVVLVGAPSPASSPTCTRASRSCTSRSPRPAGPGRAGPRPRASTWTACWTGSTTIATCPSSSSSTCSIRTLPTSRTGPTTRCGPIPKGRERVPAPARGGEEGRAGRVHGAARHGHAATSWSKAGIDPAAFIRYSKDWYDGSIRGMDAEIARLVERLRGAGARATARWSRSTPITARSSTTTAACGTGRASTARWSACR